ncbi:MAG: hypothetical protein HFE52_05565 [Clostridia bacterium]|mgnify:CR=1 FL=1|nr:hypothetical protein [Clostridia bacterium]MCI8980121.1 hypothetical protein [Clostridia bacterium]
MKNIHTIRRIVATMANRLKKMGLTLSAAFKKAWELVKGKAINTKVAGVTKGNRQKALHRIAKIYGAAAVKVRLERDTANLYDNHAVKVVISVNGSLDYVIGYIPRNLAYIVSGLLDCLTRVSSLKQHLKRSEDVAPKGRILYYNDEEDKSLTEKIFIWDSLSGMKPLTK